MRHRPAQAGGRPGRRSGVDPGPGGDLVVLEVVEVEHRRRRHQAVGEHVAAGRRSTTRGRRVRRGSAPHGERPAPPSEPGQLEGDPGAGGDGQPTEAGGGTVVEGDVGRSAGDRGPRRAGRCPTGPRAARRTGRPDRTGRDPAAWWPPDRRDPLTPATGTRPRPSGSARSSWSPGVVAGPRPTRRARGRDGTAGTPDARPPLVPYGWYLWRAGRAGDGGAGDDRPVERTDEPLVLHVIPTPLARGAQREARALADELDAPGRPGPPGALPVRRARRGGP